MYITNEHGRLRVTTIPLGAMTTNCYFVWDVASRQAIIVDPADSGEFLLEVLGELELKPTAIVFTHAHFDHVLGSLALSSIASIPTWLHAADIPLLARAQKSAAHWLGYPVDPVPPATNLLTSKTTFELDNESLSIMHLPGHTPGGIGIGVFSGSAPFICSGDLITDEGLGTSTHSYSSKVDFKNSFERLAKLPTTTLLYPGHGKTILAEHLDFSVQ